MNCPRCSGPTVAEQDQYGSYRSCLHCGWLTESGPPDTLPLDMPRNPQPPYRQRALAVQRQKRRQLRDAARGDATP